MDWKESRHRFRDAAKRGPPPRCFSIGGEDFPQIPYGAHQDDLDFATCDDGGVPRGRLHDLDCDLEKCPGCGRQAISCDCFYDD